MHTTRHKTAKHSIYRECARLLLLLDLELLDQALLRGGVASAAQLLLDAVEPLRALAVAVERCATRLHLRDLPLLPLPRLDCVLRLKCRLPRGAPLREARLELLRLAQLLARKAAVEVLQLRLVLAVHALQLELRDGDRADAPPRRDELVHLRRDGFDAHLQKKRGNKRKEENKEYEHNKRNEELSKQKK